VPCYVYIFNDKLFVRLSVNVWY